MFVGGISECSLSRTNYKLPAYKQFLLSKFLKYTMNYIITAKLYRCTVTSIYDAA